MDSEFLDIQSSSLVIKRTQIQEIQKLNGTFLLFLFGIFINFFI